MTLTNRLNDCHMLIPKLKKYIHFMLGRHKAMNQLRRYAKYEIGTGTYGAPKFMTGVG